ncbi:response regulator transcription factor [Methylobacterium sp. A54F]
MSRPRILCVEDDRPIAELIEEVLAEAGFCVTVAGSGPEGLARLAGDWALVICDIDLPGFGGLDLLRRARAGAVPGPLPPFVFLTAFGQRANQIEARRLGCDDFVTKPVDFELLVAVLRNVIQRAPGPAGRNGAVQAIEPAAGDPAPAGPATGNVRLTAREREIVTWVSRGKSSADVAQIVGISERTVNFHIENVMRKLGVATRMQAAITCLTQGLIEA